MREITKTELQIVKELKEKEVLQPLRGYQLDYRNGLIMVTCTDGDQMYDLFTTHAGLCPSNPNRTRIHLLTRHGGALLIPLFDIPDHRADENLLEAIGEAKSLLRDIKKAHSSKHINAVALYAHVPCLITDESNITIETSLYCLDQAKQCVENLNLGLHVACFFHVAYSEKKKRSYYVSLEKLDEWLKSKRS